MFCYKNYKLDGIDGESKTGKGTSLRLEGLIRIIPYQNCIHILTPAPNPFKPLQKDNQTLLLQTFTSLT